MFLMMGIGSGQKELGVFGGIPCLYCARRCRMMLIKQFQYFHLFFIPLFRFGVVYSLTCIDCAAVYTLDKNKGRALEHDPSTVIDTADLTPAGRAVRRCSRCGSCVQPEDRFCPRCGTPLDG